MTVKNWKDIAEAKKDFVKSSIPLDWVNENIKHDMSSAGYVNTSDYLDTILPAEERSITKLTVLELKEKIGDGKLSAVDVTKAFCHRAALAHQILNCCSEIFFDKALERAQELDDYYKKNGKVLGPLHGIPISLKDQVDLPGFDSSIGYVELVNKPKTEISVLAEYLLSAGAVFYVKTTVPMAMMSPETISNVYGYTYNACNNKLACGGSSGGEGALIGAGGSPLGFGTDIGGSIRIPSAFQGLHALKPSATRFSYLRVTNSYSGQEIMPSVIGPMSRSLADVEFMTKLVFNAELWTKDPKTVPVPYREYPQEKTKKLVLGVWKFDNKVMPHPPVKRALEQAVKALESQGHEIVELDFECHSKIMDTAAEIYTADEGQEVIEMCKLSGEPVVQNVLDNIAKEPGAAPLSLAKWWELCKKLYECQQEFLSFWNDTKKLSGSGKPIDAILCPVWPSASFLPNKPPTLNYTSVFNAMNCPCVVLPVTKADKTIDVVDANYKPVDATDKWVYESYDPELFDKMPICVQVVGKTLEDEKALSVASVLEAALNTK